MSRKYKFHDNDKLYFISYATVYWIDVFIREEYNQVIIDSWKHCQEKRGLEIYGWCIMTSHVHMIIGSKKDKLLSCRGLHSKDILFEYAYRETPAREVLRPGKS